MYAKFGSPAVFVLYGGCLSGMQRPLAEEIQLGAAIALPFQQRQFGDLTLDLPVTVGQLEGVLIAACWRSKLLAAFTSSSILLARSSESSVKSSGRPLAHYQARALGQRRGRLMSLILP
jgi:hypothetical protein